MPFKSGQLVQNGTVLSWNTHTNLNQATILSGIFLYFFLLPNNFTPIPLHYFPYLFSNWRTPLLLIMLLQPIQILAQTWPNFGGALAACTKQFWAVLSSGSKSWNNQIWPNLPTSTSFKPDNSSLCATGSCWKSHKMYSTQNTRNKPRAPRTFPFNSWTAWSLSASLLFILFLWRRLVSALSAPVPLYPFTALLVFLCPAFSLLLLKILEQTEREKERERERKRERGVIVNTRLYQPEKHPERVREEQTDRQPKRQVYKVGGTNHAHPEKKNKTQNRSNSKLVMPQEHSLAS